MLYVHLPFLFLITLAFVSFKFYILKFVPANLSIRLILAHAGTHIFVRSTHMQDRAQSKIITIYLWATKNLYVSTIYMGMDYMLMDEDSCCGEHSGCC
jgi:hypothetical protein